MNDCNVDGVQTSFPNREYVLKKENNISRVCLNCVFRKSPFGNEMVEVQLMKSCECGGECDGLYLELKSVCYLAEEQQ